MPRIGSLRINRAVSCVMRRGAANEEKKLCQRLAQAVEMLPDEKREFILGYAEGVIAMANELRASNAQAQASA